MKEWNNRLHPLRWLAAQSVPATRELLLAVRNAVRNRRRSLVALIGIAVGVAALLFAGGFIDWILHELRERTIRSQLGHVQVRRAERGGQGNGRAHALALLPASAPERSRIERMPHVTSVAPRLSVSGLISRNDTTLAFVGNGIDPRIDITASSADDLVDGKPLDAAAPHRIQLGEGLAASLRVKPGDSAVLLVNLPGGGINAADVTIGGIFRTVSKTYDDAAVRVPLSLAHTLLKTDGADVWIISLDRTEATEQTIAALRTDPALAGLSFVPWTSLADFYNKAVVLYARQFRIMQTLIAVIIVLSILNTMMMSVAERTWEIGTMMAMGTPRAGILRMFLFEGAILGIIGGLAGVLLGFVVNTLVSAIGIPMPPPPGMRQGFLAEASFGAPLVGWAFVLAVIATTFASVFPAVRSSRLVIVDALRASH